jgi:hypothetical protein
MATTTPNYGWTVPTSSDLVKNGATAIETLGDSVDDSLWSSGYGQAGKNKIINGDMAINQRGFTSSTTDGVFPYDRFGCRLTGDGTSTVSTQTFTPGAAPVAGYEAANYVRFVTTGQTSAAVRTVLRQTIEGVRTFAGQTVTLSFWAKAATGTPKIAANLFQAFGSGGSANVNAPAGTVTISTSWARYSLTVAIPSISGKTIGTSNGLGVDLAVSAGSTYNTEFSSIGIQTGTFDIWGIQVEYGSKATPFQLAGGGDPQSELAMCQRYYYRATLDAIGARLGSGYVNSTTELNLTVPFPVTMRTKPTALEQNGTAADYQVLTTGNTITNCNAVPAISTATQAMQGVVQLPVASGLVAGQGGTMRVATAGAYLGWSAEL